MSRRLVAAAALPLFLLQAGCITVTIRTRVLADGSVERTLETSPHSAEVARATAARFPPPWSVVFTSGDRGVKAQLRVAPGQDFAPNEAGLVVSWRDYLLFTDYRYEEDFSRVRLGRAAPVIAPRPPAPMPLAPFLRGLFHERNLAAIERRARESLKTQLEVAMPGSVRGGNFSSRSDEGALVWEFNYRAPAAPWATSRVWHPLRAAAIAAAAIAAGLGMRARTRRTALPASR